MLINLVSNSAAELLPILSFPLNSEELLYGFLFNLFLILFHIKI